MLLRSSLRLNGNRGELRDIIVAGRMRRSTATTLSSHRSMDQSVAEIGPKRNTAREQILRMSCFAKNNAILDEKDSPRICEKQLLPLAALISAAFACNRGNPGGDAISRIVLVQPLFQIDVFATRFLLFCSGDKRLEGGHWFAVLEFGREPGISQICRNVSGKGILFRLWQTRDLWQQINDTLAEHTVYLDVLWCCMEYITKQNIRCRPTQDD
jgi:hypothetical protein